MLYTFWLLLAIVGVSISILGIYRLLSDDIRADATDAFTFLLGFIIVVVSSLTVSDLDFVSCSGTSCFTYPYQGMAIFTLPLFAFAALDMAMFFVSILKAVDISKAKKQFVEYQ